MNWMSELFGTEKPVIGMVHLRALPGTSGYAGDMRMIYEEALASAHLLDNGGVDAIMVENFHDGPYKPTMDLAQSTALAAVTSVIQQQVSVPVGVDAAFCDYESALSCALAGNAVFVRLAVFVDTVISPFGVMYPCSADAMRYRKMIGAEHIKILADVQVKYTHMLCPSISIEESAANAVAGGADAIIVTGTHTGEETPLDLLKRVKQSVSVPVIIGSGFKIANAVEQLKVADGAIVGTSLSTNGIVDRKKVESLIHAIGR